MKSLALRVLNLCFLSAKPMLFECYLAALGMKTYRLRMLT
ncbi:hypothetical protein EVA_01925 [gut metagenome]|uniref:Uncharacterized protein n=1 Tax=gut metagenome TaxID=749906 RepID=J9GP60_9ZZZZ